MGVAPVKKGKTMRKAQVNNAQAYIDGFVAGVASVTAAVDRRLRQAQRKPTKGKRKAKARRKG